VKSCGCSSWEICICWSTQFVELPNYKAVTHCHSIWNMIQHSVIQYLHFPVFCNSDLYHRYSNIIKCTSRYISPDTVVGIYHTYRGHLTCNSIPSTNPIANFSPRPLGMGTRPNLCWAQKAGWDKTRYVSVVLLRFCKKWTWSGRRHQTISKHVFDSKK